MRGCESGQLFAQARGPLVLEFMKVWAHAVPTHSPRCCIWARQGSWSSARAVSSSGNRAAVKTRDPKTSISLPRRAEGRPRGHVICTRALHPLSGPPTQPKRQGLGRELARPVKALLVGRRPTQKEAASPNSSSLLCTCLCPSWDGRHGREREGMGPSRIAGGSPRNRKWTRKGAKERKEGFYSGRAKWVVAHPLWRFTHSPGDYL